MCGGYMCMNKREVDGKEYREKSYTTETIQWLSLQEKS